MARLLVRRTVPAAPAQTKTSPYGQPSSPDRDCPPPVRIVDDERVVRHTNFARPRPPPLANLNTAAKTQPALPTPLSGDWPLPSPSGVPRSARAPPPAPLNFSASDYTEEIGGGPWTPPPAPEDEASPPRTPTAEAGAIGVARGLSIRQQPERDLFIGAEVQGVRRPDFGLKSPTGIADSFGTTFI